jgi:hypothetical protein
MYPTVEQMAMVQDKVQERRDNAGVVDYTDGHSVAQPSIYAEQPDLPVHRSAHQAQVGRRDPHAEELYPGSSMTIGQSIFSQSDAADTRFDSLRDKRRKRKDKHSSEPFSEPIASVAKALNREVRSVREYMKAGYLPEATHRTAGNQRRWSARQVAGLAKIARQLGLDTSHHISPFVMERLTELSHQLWRDLEQNAL